MLALKQDLVKIARSPGSTVLLIGESGTGKDVAARVIHESGDRAAAPFMNITCSAMPEALLESELFGHERGAFTDAKKQRKGLLELAEGGTVFLDEIGEMSPALQAKLLRFLEERAFKRVGGATDVRVQVRVIAATHRDLSEGVRRGTFRHDLYYRLQVLPVRVPALRERTGDVPILVEHFVAALAPELGKSISAVSPDALAKLSAWGWPGNVRELRNTVERAIVLCDSDVLGPSDFPLPDPQPNPAIAFALPAEGIDLARLEEELLVQALVRADGNHTRAASLLGMNRDQVRYRVEKLRMAGSLPAGRRGSRGTGPRLLS